MRSFLAILGLIIIVNAAQSPLEALTAPTPTCFVENDQSVLDAADPRVVRGDGIFHTTHGQYSFVTYSSAKQDPNGAGKICLHYEIENPGSQKIQSFRWKDIGLPFTDIPHSPRVRFDNNTYSKYDRVGKVSSDVAAFENSPSSTETLLPIEKIEHNGGGSQAGPVQLYKVTEQFPSVESTLTSAGLPLTPVFAVSRAEAGEIKPLVSRFRMGESELIVSSEFQPERSALDTQITIHARNAIEDKLFAPAVQKGSVDRLSADSIIEFAKRVQSSQHAPKLPLVNGIFSSSTGVPKEIDQSAPMFFVVNYPVTVRTNQGAFCIVVSGLNAFPINVDDRYCERR
jgi:hypothetical protein